MVGCKVIARDLYLQEIVMATVVVMHRLAVAIASTAGQVKVVTCKNVAILIVAGTVNATTALVFVTKDGADCHVEVNPHINLVAIIAKNYITVINMVSVTKLVTNVYVN